MLPAPFEYHRPTTLDEALSLLANTATTRRCSPEGRA